MTDSVLIHADSLRDPDMFFATGIAVVDPFTYIETGGRRIVLTSSLEADAARRDSTADEVWLVDEFDRRELIAGGMTRDEAEMEVVRRALARAGVSRAVVPPTFPLELADFLRAAGIEVEPARELFVARRRVKDGRALDGIRAAQRATEESFRKVRELLGSSAPSPAGLVLGGELLTCERIRDAVEQTLRAHGCDTDRRSSPAAPSPLRGTSSEAGRSSPDSRSSATSSRATGRRGCTRT